MVAAARDAPPLAMGSDGSRGAAGVGGTFRPLPNRRLRARSGRRSLAHVFLGVSPNGAAASSAGATVLDEPAPVNVVISRCSASGHAFAPVS
jgi:hypothetical protein